jgi:hypothetical protein
MGQREVHSSSKSILTLLSLHLFGVKYSRLRTFLFTFALGLASAGIYARVLEKLEEIPVNLPKVESETPLIIIPCPERVRHIGINQPPHMRSGPTNCSLPGGGGG